MGSFYKDKDSVIMDSANFLIMGAELPTVYFCQNNK